MKYGHQLNILLLLLFMIGCEENPKEQYFWNSSAPEAQGMNKQILDSAFIVAANTGFIDGLVVIRNGYLVAEDYFNGYIRSRPHIIASVSKSFLSAITGIALHRGDIDSLEEKVLDYFPEYIYSGMDERKYQITIRHLLTMRMGIRDESEDNYGVYWGLYYSPNWIKATIESPLVFDPGERMRYNTFQTHLLSGIITRATQKSTLKYGKEFLFDPMGIDVDEWKRDPQGIYFGGNEMYFTPQEVALFGSLYLKHGMLNGKQIVSAAWVDSSLSPSTNNTHPNEWGALKNYNYAHLWWLGQINEKDMFMGYGYGGQFLVVFPELDLIVVSTANYFVDPEVSTIQEWAIFDIISKYILPSIME